MSAVESCSMLRVFQSSVSLSSTRGILGNITLFSLALSTTRQIIELVAQEPLQDVGFILYSSAQPTSKEIER